MPRTSTPSKMKKKNRNATAGAGPVGPTSPPQTPKASSPPSGLGGKQKKGGLGGRKPKREQVPHQYLSDTHPTAGNGFNFSAYQPESFRPDELSPRSSASSLDEEDSGSESSGSDCPPRSHSSTESIEPSVRLPRPRTPSKADGQRRAQEPPPPSTAKVPFVAARIVVEATFEVVELDGSDDEGCVVLLPDDVIEYADSERSQSRPRRPRPDHVDRKMASDMRALVFSSDEDETDDEYEKMVKQMREEKRRKRMSTGSIGKRTISERGSDSDREDLLYHCELNAGLQESGDMRRMRRRLGNRHSLQFQDPPPPRIDELDEPDSSEEILDDSELLARELPYYDYVSMEIDSS